MKKILIILLTLFSGLTQAQDIFSDYFYSADRIIKNREIISLTDAQAEKIKKIHSDNATDFTTLKRELDAAITKLKTLLEETKTNQAVVQKQMNEVLILENSLKKKQLNTLIAINNELTETQQKTLKNIKKNNLTGNSSIPPVPPVPPVYIQTTPNTPTAQPLYALKTDNSYLIIPDVKEIKPENIEAIEVWKGDKAIEKFGQNGKNGAIIITLRKVKNEEENKM
jgi:hypothetical protein